jgi:hypothetical protein
MDSDAQVSLKHPFWQAQPSGHAHKDVRDFEPTKSEKANSDWSLVMHDDETDKKADLLRPRPFVSSGELNQMPASLKPGEAQPWSRLSRSAFYAALQSGELASVRIGHAIRIPTRRFLSQLGVLEED